MAIYLDANLLYPWKTFAEVERVALTIVAQQIRQSVLIPDVAAWEAEAHYRRELTRATRELRKAHKAAVEGFRGDELQDIATPDIDERVARWREELGHFAKVLQLHPEDAAEAHHREAFGIAPAKRVTDDKGEDVGGKGGRDAAIWLTVVRDHSTRNEEGHFISKNTSDFGRTAELPLALKDDLHASQAPLNNYGSLDDFLAFLGNPRRDFQVPLEEIDRRLPRVLRVVLPVTSHIPRAVFGNDYDWNKYRYLTEIKDARPIKALASRRYEQADDAITVINALWEIVVDCFQFSTEIEIGPVIGYEDVVVTGPIQAYLPDDDERLAQVVSAQLRVATLPTPTHGVGG